MLSVDWKCIKLSADIESPAVYLKLGYYRILLWHEY